jgi:hypothetical protein
VLEVDYKRGEWLRKTEGSDATRESETIVGGAVNSWLLLTKQQRLLCTSLQDFEQIETVCPPPFSF